MAKNVTLVALSQMVDISLNCHEGIINFQALHTLLNVIVQQLSLNDVAVEFRGPDSDRIQALISTVKSHTNIYPEYTIVGEKGKRIKKKKPKNLKDVIKDPTKSSEETASVVSPEGSLVGVKTSDLQTVVIVESESSLPQHAVALSKTTFDDLLEDIQAMKDQIRDLTALPTNENLIDAIKSNSGPVLDMFNIINLTKRMDATEKALAKIGSLLEDLAKDATGDIADKIQDLKESVNTSPSGSRRSSLINIEARITELEKLVQEMLREIQKDGKNTSGVKPNEKVGEDNSKEEKEGSEKDENKSHKSGKNTEEGRIKIFTPQRYFTSVTKNVNMGDLSALDAQILTQEEFKNLNDWINESIQECDKDKIFGPSSGGDVNIQIIESKFQDCNKQINEMNSLYTAQIGIINDRFNTVQGEMKDVLNKMQIILPGGDSTGIDAEISLNLATKLEILEKEIFNLIDQAEKVEEQKKLSDLQTQDIMEQIDVLKIVKANREDLEDALGDKADICAINRKVSHDQFEATCDSLTQGIEEALQKLQNQEELWHQAFNTINKEIGNKLDKVEVDPIKDFVNNKLKALQEKFKALTALKKEQEGAATKMKLLKNVNCISCDKDVVMKTEMDPTLRPKAYAMPPNRSMAPYLAYELDQLRKQQKCTPGGKNMNFVETAMKITRGNKEKDHLCNRYCGGSHTVTTPQQRVTRLGHFLEQWGPEIAPLQDEYVQGSDKQMYKARDSGMIKKGRPNTAESQQDRNSLNAALKERISRDEEQRSLNTTSSNKNYNIGSVEIKFHGSKHSGSILSKKSETKFSKTNLEQKPPTEAKDSQISTDSKQSRVQIVTEPTNF